MLSSLPSLPPSLGNWLLVPSPLLSCPTPWCWSSSASLWPLNESAEWKDACSERAPAMKEWLQCGWWLSLQVKKVNVCRWDVFLGLSKRASCSLPHVLLWIWLVKFLVLLLRKFKSEKTTYWSKRLWLVENEFSCCFPWEDEGVNPAWWEVKEWTPLGEKMKEWTPLGEKWRSEPRLVIHKPSLA